MSTETDTRLASVHANGEPIPPDNPLDFDAQEARNPLKRELRGIKWQGKEYAIKLASEAEHIKYHDASTRVLRLDDGKVVGVAAGFAALDTYLLSLCMYELGQDKDGKERFIPLTVQFLRSGHWAPQQLKLLAVEARTLNGLAQPQGTKTRKERLAELEKEAQKLREEEERETEDDPGNS